MGVADAATGESLQLKKNVILAYTDIAAAGSRALYGLKSETKDAELNIAELKDPKPACECLEVGDGAKSISVHPLQVFNCTQDDFSIIIINTVLSPSNCHCIANKVIDLCVQSGVQQLTVLSVLRLDLAKKSQHPMYENCFFIKSETDHPCLPDDTHINDPLLSTLIQMIQVERIPTRVLVIPGHAAHHGTASGDDGSEQAVKTFQETINTLTGLEFNKDYSLAMVYKGLNEEDVDMASMIYM
ncbi:hypothetical protein NP493_80g03055 [Ridgeia piscesae]|uniref:Uncharacterized protein n=1 Tax=Ridgeia piscesae TaxID=27915 RepID=A0AAD9UI54_RIDPI|nr:hypothetical protein NP493_80g03055 [Ridgeia piscesae]